MRRRSFTASVLVLAAACVTPAAGQAIQNIGEVWNGASPAPATPPTPWTSFNSLWVGKNGGSAATYIRQGATVGTASSIAVVGYGTGTSGFMRVSDFGTTLNANTLVVASGGGQGRLEVLDGARVVSTSFDLAWTDAAPSGGAVLISGPGAAIRITPVTGGGFSTIGLRFGCVGDLTIANGGLYETANDFYAAYWIQPGDMGVANINLTGAGSRLRIGGQLQLGNATSGAATLNIGAGSAVSVNQYTIGKTGVVDLDGGTFGLGTGILGTVHGTIRGNGTVTGALVNDGGVIAVDAGHELRIATERATDQLINRGRIENIGGTLSVATPASNQVGSQMVGRNATFQFTAASAFNNLGQIAFTGGNNDFAGDLTNGGKVLIDNSSVVTFRDDVNNSTEIKATPGSRAIFLGTLSGNGVTGGGIAVASASVAPAGEGAEGVMSFGGPVQLEPTASLAIDLAGVTAFDRLAAADQMTLAGTLELALVDGYQPAMYVGHRVVQAQASDGRFDGINGITIDGDRALAVTYDEGGVVVTCVIPGDANLNGAVNFDDLLTVAQHYGASQEAQWTDGDFSGDTAVEFDDLLTLAQHYGTSAGAAGELLGDAGVSERFATDWALAQSLVPEPGVGGLALAAIAAFGRRRNG